MAKESWIEVLKQRWKLGSLFQVVIVLIVFACTGFTVLFIKKPVLDFLTGGKDSAIASILYWIFILPVYNVILLFYGFLFGQFTFFWQFEKRTFMRTKALFGRIFSKVDKTK